MKFRQNFRCHFIKIEAIHGTLTGKTQEKFKLGDSQQKSLHEILGITSLITWPRKYMRLKAINRRKSIKKPIHETHLPALMRN